MHIVRDLLALAAATCLIAPANAQQSQRLGVGVDPRFELISVVETLTGRGFRNLLATDDTPYRRDVLAWFSPYKSHAAIARFTELSAQDFNFDAPMLAMACLSAPPNLEFAGKPEDCGAARAGGAESLLAWISQLRDFVRQADFMTFFRAHAGLYALIDESTRAKIGHDYAVDLETYFGTRQASYRIVLAPLLAGGNYGPSLLHDNGVRDLYGVIASTGQTRGVPQFGTVEDFRKLVWHEFGHSFVNPEIDRLSAQVARSEKLMAPIEKTMQSHAYSQWKTVVYEHVVRAVTIRLAFRELGDEEGQAALLREKAAGFAYVELLTHSLTEYEQHRDRYPAFRDFAPRLLTVLEDLSQRSLPPEFFDVPFTGTLSSADSGGGPEVLIVPTGETDAAAQQKIVDYVKKVRAQFFEGAEILTDEQALARDLSSSRVCVFGTSQGNKWLARYAKSLPALPLLVQRTEPGPLRLIATMPNPQNPKRGVTVYSATAPEAVDGIFGLFHSDDSSYTIGSAQTVLATGVYHFRDGVWTVK